MSDDEQDDHRCGGCPRRLTAGWYLCELCSEKVAADLLEIGDRYARLSAAPSREPGRYDQSGGGKPGSRPPLRLDVVALRDFRSGQSDARMWQGADKKQHQESDSDTPGIARALVFWVDRIVDERGYEHRPDPTVDASVEFLGKQDDWIARWSAAGELAKNVRKLRNRLRSATGEPNPKPLGKCIRLVDDPARSTEQVTCGAPVFPPEKEPEGGAYVSSILRCASRHKHEYLGHQVILLRLENEREEREAS